MVAQEEVLPKVMWEMCQRHKQNLSLLTCPTLPSGKPDKSGKVACSVTQQLFLPQPLPCWAITNKCQ